MVDLELLQHLHELAQGNHRGEADLRFLAPAPQLIAYQQLLEAGTFTILGYPLATVIAEKLSTAVELGDLNTRDRDYGDLYRLLRANILRADEVSTALAATAAHRQITLRPLSSSITDLPQQRQSSYTAWLRRQELSRHRLPNQLRGRSRRDHSLRGPTDQRRSSRHALGSRERSVDLTNASTPGPSSLPG
jgi:hypothetical protein